MVASKNVLDSIFNAPEEDVQTFREALGASAVEGFAPGAPEKVVRKIVSGQPDKIDAPKNLKMQLSGFIRIYSGWHNDDYVWHLEPAAVRRTWKVSAERVVFAIAKTMHPEIPSHVEVKIWHPPRDWEIKTFTFKAMGIRREWGVTDDDLAKLTLTLFEVLNPLV